MANPAYSRNARFTPSQLITQLTNFASETDHEFWPDDISLRDGHVFAAERILSSRQLTDLYLLAIATRHGARLATFDEGISLSVVSLAKPENLCRL